MGKCWLCFSGWGRPRRNAIDSQGFSQRSITARGVGWVGHKEELSGGVSGGVAIRTKVVVVVVVAFVEGAFLNICCWWDKSLLLLSGIGTAVALNHCRFCPLLLRNVHRHSFGLPLLSELVTSAVREKKKPQIDKIMIKNEITCFWLQNKTFCKVEIMALTWWTKV